MPALRLTHEDYQIEIICALTLEKAAVEAMLDEEHPRLKRKEHDVNDYTLGRTLSVNLKGHMAVLCNGISGIWRREVYSGALEH
jgi:hypothetical protein